MQKENLFFLPFLFLDLPIHSQPDFNNKAVKWLVFHKILSVKRQITTNRANDSPVLRNFAVAKVLPLGFTDKTSYIV